MTDEGWTADDWRELREMRKAKRRANLKEFDKSGWTEHCPTHFSRDLCGSRLDYWPSTKKFKWRGRYMSGDVYGFINKRSK